MARENSLIDVDAATLKAWLDQGKAIVVDVREPAEHARECIPEAVLMPLSAFKADQVATNGKRVVLYCASGMRSQQAAKALLAAGHTGVAHLKGGLPSWKQAGLPTKVDRKAPLPLMRQVQIIAGSLIVLGVALGYGVSPLWFLLSGFVGAGLLFAGVTGHCGMAMMLAKLPYNKLA
jgi:rhodanese-related sulfurtransferase